MHRTMRIIGYAFAGLFLLVLGGCGLPDTARKTAEVLPGSISEATKYVDERTKALVAQLSVDKEFVPYAESEKWSEKFTAASQELARAQEAFLKEVKPVLDANKSADVEKLLALVKKVETMIGAARLRAREPEMRLAFLKEARSKVAEWTKEAAELHALTVSDLEALSSLAAAFSGTYPDRAVDIKKRLLAGATAFNASLSAAQAVAGESALGTVRMNYARFGDSYTAVKKARADMVSARPIIERVVRSLDKSYSKILIDMKIDYAACVSRVSWEESESVEWPKETTFDYPCKPVSEGSYDVADEFDDRNHEFVIFQPSGWWGRTLNLYRAGNVTEDALKQLWKELDIDPAASWPRGDNYATFHVRAVTARYFHRYSYIENGVRRDGDWEEVTGEFFDEHDEHLGMSLLEKPQGVFDDEAVTTPSPAGMALVGDARTGRWEERGNQTVWVWWPHYHVLYGNYYGPGWSGYSRSDWSEWRQEREAGRVYTGNGAYGTNGSSTRTGPLASSEFAKRGGFKTPSAQVRGLGPSNRSQGPQTGGK